MKFETFQLGNVTFDPTTNTLTHLDGSAAQLRNKSKEVLNCLLKTPNRTVSKTDIMNSVWSDVTVSDESLVQCIADIRKIIGKEAKQIVETVPREGYRLNLPTQNATPKLKWPAVMLATFVLASVGAWFLWPQADAPPPMAIASTELIKYWYMID